MLGASAPLFCQRLDTSRTIDRATHYAHTATDVALTKSTQTQGEIMKKIVIASLAVLVTTMALAYEIHHPNMRDAYGATENAIHHIQEAQAANKGIEFGGHGDKALAALQHAEQEIIAADQWNDAHHR
jgi:hypothetical protein